MSEANPTTTGEPTPDVNELAARLDDVQAYQENIVRGHITDRLDDLEATINERDDHIDQLESRIDTLEQKLETLAGLAEDETGTPQKRAVDLAVAMVRQARNRADGRVALTYKDVKDTLASMGHESLHDPQLYTAMDDVAVADGFSETNVTRDGTTMQAVAANIEDIAGEEFVNEIKNENGGGAGTEAPDSATMTT